MNESDDQDDLDLLEEYLNEADFVDLGEVLRESLVEDYDDASPEEMDEALLNVFDSMTAAEALSLGNVLSRIEKGAAQTLANPAVGQLAKTSLPIAGGAIGTAIGGPVVGTAVGQGLGKVVANSLPAKAKAGQPQPAKRSVAEGSEAARMLVVLLENRSMLKSLLALAMGKEGRKSIGGHPVGAYASLLSTLAGQAVADADELLRDSQEMPAYLRDAEDYLGVDPAVPADRARALYAALLDAENESLAEARHLL
ncbi:hypothetical protein [Nonomuraea sp. NPDC049141]|uniref:hypothetical protein n=1 Tax=Nonomuraea sp. NPDC049141 TaxID=3155500 RepID=UPI0033E1A987